MPFLRAKGLQHLQLVGIDQEPRSQCPSCGRRVCNAPAKPTWMAYVDVSMPFLRAKGLQRAAAIDAAVAVVGLNALPAGEGSATPPPQTTVFAAAGREFWTAFA